MLTGSQSRGRLKGAIKLKSGKLPVYIIFPNINKSLLSFLIMNKRGQFFLIAAIVIVAILIGLSLVYTSTRTPRSEEQEIVDLSNEIYFEGAQVIDNGVYTDRSEAQIEQNLQVLMEDYSILYPDSEITSIYGDHYTTRICKPTGQVSLGSSQISADCKQTVDSGTIERRDGRIIVNIGEETYEFEDTPGETFYVIIRKESDTGEIIVET